MQTLEKLSLSARHTYRINSVVSAYRQAFTLNGYTEIDSAAFVQLTLSEAFSYRAFAFFQDSEWRFATTGVQLATNYHELVSLARHFMQHAHIPTTTYSIVCNLHIFDSYIYNEFLGLDAVEVSTIKKVVSDHLRDDESVVYALVEAALGPANRTAEVLGKLRLVIEAYNTQQFDGLSLPPQCQNAMKELELLSGHLQCIFNPFMDIVQTDVAVVIQKKSSGSILMRARLQADAMAGEVNLRETLHDTYLHEDTEFDLSMYIKHVAYRDAAKLVEKLRDEEVSTYVSYDNHDLKSIRSRYHIVLDENACNTGKFQLNKGTDSVGIMSLERVISHVKDARYLDDL